MKKLAILLAALSLPAVTASAQEPESNDIQVTFYQLSLETGCKDAGQRSGSPEKEVASFCGCMLKTLREDMTAEEWRAAYAYSSRHESEAEMKVLAPHMQKLGACRDTGV